MYKSIGVDRRIGIREMEKKKKKKLSKFKRPEKYLSSTVIASHDQKKLQQLQPTQKEI